MTKKQKFDEFSPDEEWRLKCRVQEFRERAGLPRQVLAEYINVHRNTISRIETGKLRPSVEIALRLARFFEVPVETLFVSWWQPSYLREVERRHLEQWQLRAEVAKLGGTLPINEYDELPPHWTEVE